MSMNAHIIAERWVVPVKGGAAEIQREFWRMWQTPTKVSYAIAEAEDPVAEYKQWVMSQEMNDPEVDESCEHIQELDKWLENRTQRGFDILVEVW